MSDKPGLGINWVNSAGSALAAVSAAVVLSTLGTAGTLIGAAMGSLVITVGGALYSRSIQVTKERAAALAARRRPASAETPTSAAAVLSTQTIQSTQTFPAVPPGDETDRPASVGVAEDRAYPSTGRGLSWKRIVAGTLALFVVAMGLIVGVELITGRPLSSWTGGSSDTDRGTSIPGTNRNREQDEPKQQDQPTPTPTDDPNPTLTSEPTPDEPTETPEPTEPADPTEPTETAEPTEPATPTPPPPSATPAPPPGVKPTG